MRVLYQHSGICSSDAGADDIVAAVSLCKRDVEATKHESEWDICCDHLQRWSA